MIEDGTGDVATVLIADDDSLIRMVLRMAIEQRGHRVLEAENGAELLAQLADGGADLCIMDAAMPGASLSERLGALQRQDDKAVGVVVMSGYSRPPDVVEEHRVRFLSKPIELDTLDRLLKELLPAGPGAGE
jgi:two-component system OmpR family response regulator